MKSALARCLQTDVCAEMTRCFAVALFAGIALSLVASDARGGEQPNLVFVIADDLTYRDIGCYGGQAHTPNIDRLATEGMRLTRCFQAAPMCSPTRHNIYTGLYPVKSGAYPNHTFAKPDTKSIVHYLQPLGYRVALSGKTHIGPKTVFPFEYSGKKNNPDMGAVDQLFAECARSGTPFCLFACSNEPHTPWNKGDASQYPPEEVELPPYIADTPVVRENFSRYLAEITYYDGQVGEILAMLDEHRLTDNTLVMVVSEQGNAFPFAKWTCYGHGLQSAMIVRWPNKVVAGSTSDAMVEYTDVVPTFVAAAGGTPDANLDGRSMLPVLQGQADQHKSFVFGEMTTRGIINGSDTFGIRTVRSTSHRLIWNLNHETKFTNACTASPLFQSMVDAAESGNPSIAELVHKYHYRPEFELYDCDADPLEMTNLAADPEHANLVKQLKGRLDEWMESQGDRGAETEARALLRQRKYAGMTLEQADAKWQQAKAKTKAKGKSSETKRSRP